jgi:hypothetical protein
MTTATQFVHSAVANCFIYVVNKTPRTELCAKMAFRFQIANSCSRWHGIFKGLSQYGERADFSINLRASLLNLGFQMNLISSRSILLDSTFNNP